MPLLMNPSVSKGKAFDGIVYCTQVAYLLLDDRLSDIAAIKGLLHLYGRFSKFETKIG